MNLFNDDVVILDRVPEIACQSTSKGNQRKWYDPIRNVFIKEQFYYHDKYWRDDLVEVIASAIGSQLHTSIKITQYQSRKYKLGNSLFYGCESENFCTPEESFISFNKLLKINKLDYEYSSNAGCNFETIRKILDHTTGLDTFEYLAVLALIDFLVGNEDRHLNNFGVIFSKNDYKLAPIFDSGLGLFEHDSKYSGQPFRECISLMRCQPFSYNNKDIIDYLQPKIREYLPDTIDLSKVEIPSPKAGSYLRNRCIYLGVKLIGVE